MGNVIPPPHGGSGLINRILPELERETLFEKLSVLKTYNISNSDLSMFYRMGDGGLSPLEGPMVSEEFYHVLDKEFIERNNHKFAWTIPIAFPIYKNDAEQLDIGETVVVKNEAHEIVGLLKVLDVYPFDKIRYVQSVYGTERTDHPQSLRDASTFLHTGVGKSCCFSNPKSFTSCTRICYCLWAGKAYP